MAKPGPSELTLDELREIFLLPNHLIALIKDDGTFYKVNEVASPVLGWEPGEVIGKKVRDYIHPDDWALTATFIGRAFSEDDLVVEDMRNRIRHKKGSWRWISWTGRVRDGILYAHGVDVTEKVELSRQREFLETRFRTFFAQSPLGILIFDKKGNALEANQAWSDLFQAPHSALEGFNIFEDPQTEALGHLPYFQRVLEGEVVKLPPFYVDPALMEGNKPGRARWIEAVHFPIKGPDGNTEEIAAILKDVTEEIQTRKEIEELESRFRIASESLSLAVKTGKVGVWEWYPHENRVVWDETTQNIYGYAGGNYPGTIEAVSAHVHPEDRNWGWKTVTQSFSEKKAYNLDYRILRANGELRWIQASGLPIYSDGGELIRVIGTAIDITERKQREEDERFLSEISEILASSFDYVHNIQRVLDLAVPRYFDGAIVDEIRGSGRSVRIAAANAVPELKELMFELHRRFYHVLDRSHPFISSLDTQRLIIFDDLNKVLVPEKYPPEYLEAIKPLKIKTGIVTTLAGRECKLGTLGFHLTEERSGMISERLQQIAREVGYRMSLAIENSRLYHDSQEAIRARDEFLSIASHELKTPLQSLVLQNDMRKRQIRRGEGECLDPDEISRALDLEKQQLTRINRLIEDMLDISRIRSSRLSIHKQPLLLGTLVEDVCERLRPQFEAMGCKLTIETSFSPEIVADSYRLEQVIANLLTNAMKYGAGKPVAIRILPQEKTVRVEVEDHGPGIREEDQERIFHRFERAATGSGISGLGLGLYIAREIMELHGGKVFVRSVWGEGSTFVVDIPRGIQNP